MREEDAPQRMVGHVLDAYGGLDAVILNAGVTYGAARVKTQTLADFGAVMDLNFFANVTLA